MKMEMQIIADTHAHTLASGHAYSTIREMAAAARKRGLKALALTEHAPEMPGTCGLFYFQNLDVVPREADGVRLLMGAEVNIMDPDGTVDLPEKTCRDLDIVVASIHPPCYGLDHTREENTRTTADFLLTMKRSSAQRKRRERSLRSIIPPCVPRAAGKGQEKTS